MENRSGHGNAMAQAYNHMIMPLANRQDKVTQIVWGIQDFRKEVRPSSRGYVVAGGCSGYGDP